MGTNKKSGFNLTDEHLSILDRERELYVSGIVIPYTRQEAIRLIKNIRLKPIKNN